MIKPNDLKSVEFDVSVLGGYKRENVDAFIESIASDYDKIYNENLELAQKLKMCVEKIEKYQEQEEILKTAIIKAESSVQVAEENAENKIKEAEIKAEMIISESKKEAETIVTKSKFEAENIVSKAKLEAAEAIKKCEEDANKKITEINAEVEFQNSRLQAIKKEVSDFRDEIMTRYRAHLSSLTEIPKFKPDIISSQESLPATKEKDDIGTQETAAEENSANETEKKAQAEANPVSDKTITVDIKSKAASGVSDDLHDSSDESTAEFILKKKEVTKIDVPQKRFEQEMLKFGTDFDVKNDK